MLFRSTEDRVRKLYRSYVREETPVRRRRGRSPRQAGYFLRAPAVANDTRALASTLVLFGAIRARPELRQAPALEQGHRLCDAYETYREVVREPLIDFEHGELLAHALARGDDLRGVVCRGCGAFNVLERGGRPTPRCCACPAPLPEDTDRIDGADAADATDPTTELPRRSLHRPPRRMA